jgi:hypothetical protein
MTGRYEGPTGHDDATADAHGQSAGSSGIRVVRAAFVLAIVIVLGIVLLPSATRAPRLVSASPKPAHHTTAVPPTSTTRPATTTTLPAAAHGAIKVLVANGTTTAHGASEVRTWLGNRGFDTSAFPPYNTTTPESADAVYAVGNGTSSMAAEVAEALALGPSVIQVGTTPPVPTTKGADVVVVLGTDLATRADDGTLATAPASSSTSTTS